MAKFHLNPSKGPMRCSAAEGQCPYGSDAPHFPSRDLAQGAYEKILAEETNPFTSHRKPKIVTPKLFTPELHELDKTLEESSYDEILRYAQKSSAAHEKIGTLIDARAGASPLRFEKLQSLNPANPASQNPVTYKTFKELKADWDGYRNQTAVLVEAYTQSRFYKPNTEEYPSGEKVGSAWPITSYSHDDPKWYFSRFNTVGGSDVGALAVEDFCPEDEKTSFDRLSFRKVQESKIEKISKEYAEGMIRFSELSRKGPVYRGTVWEDRIRDRFANDHPDLQVWHSKDQYVKGANAWHRVNFDAIVGDKSAKTPDGILEIKTGGVPEKWENGVPANYRAQTLYYLNATGFDKAYVRVLLNDGETRDYEIYSKDEVYPGSGVIMEEYVQNRVKPWFESLKEQRKTD